MSAAPKAISFEPRRLLEMVQGNDREGLLAFVDSLPAIRAGDAVRAEIGTRLGASLRALGLLAGDLASTRYARLGAEIAKLVFACGQRCLDLGRGDRDIAVGAAAGALAFAAALGNLGEQPQLERFVVSQEAWFQEHFPKVHARLLLVWLEATLQGGDVEKFHAIRESRDWTAVDDDPALSAQRDRLEARLRDGQQQVVGR